MMFMKLTLILASALAAIAPASSFLASGPRISTPAAAATAAWRQPRREQHSSLDGGAPRSFAAAVPVRMMSEADTAVEQKGLVTVYHKEDCPFCKKVG